jgi:hypothetical protein
MNPVRDCLRHGAIRRPFVGFHDVAITNIHHRWRGIIPIVIAVAEDLGYAPQEEGIVG